MIGLKRNWCRRFAVIVVGVAAGAAQGGPAVPASLQEATAVIDLGTFPMPEHEEVLHQTATKVACSLAKADLGATVAFYKSKLGEAGWNIDSENVDPAIGFASLQLSKLGFFLTVDVVKVSSTGKIQVFVENQGNVDARALPRLAGAEEGPLQPYQVYYSVEGKVDDVAEAIRAEVKKLGWWEIGPKGGISGNTPGVNQLVMFVQRGMFLNVEADQNEATTEVSYHVGLLRMELPIMAEASGRIEFMVEPFVHLFYAAKAEPAKVLAFYRKELTDRGWKVGEASKEGETTKVALEGPGNTACRLELVGKKETTFVLMASGSGGE